MEHRTIKQEDDIAAADAKRRDGIGEAHALAGQFAVTDVGPLTVLGNEAEGCLVGKVGKRMAIHRQGCNIEEAVIPDTERLPDAAPGKGRQLVGLSALRLPPDLGDGDVGLGAASLPAWR